MTNSNTTTPTVTTTATDTSLTESSLASSLSSLSVSEKSSTNSPPISSRSIVTAATTPSQQEHDGQPQQQQQTPTKKSVWFDCIEIREFPIELGDNPAVNDGPPLTIGWNYQKQKSYEIDYYEVYREDRRQRKDLALSETQRTKLLLSHGYTLEQIYDCADQCAKVKYEREQTNKKLKWNKLNIAIEATGKTLKKIIIGTNNNNNPTTKNNKNCHGARSA